MKRTLTGSDLMKAAGRIDERYIDLAYDAAEIKKAAAGEKRRTGKLFAAECRKILGAKVVWIFLALFLALNTVLAYRAAGSTPAAGYPTDLVARFFEGYFENPAEYEARYAEIEAFSAEQMELFFEAMRTGDDDYEIETLPNRYSDDDAVPDSLLFDLVHEAIDQSEGYPDRLEKVTDAARANLEEFRRMGVKEDSFSWKYQTEVIRRYEAMRGTVHIGVEYVRGWGDYFDYRLGDVFVFLLLILAGSVIFTQEKQAGFLPVMRVSRRGRAETAGAKIVLMLFLTALFTLLFVGTGWAAFGLRIGFSSPDNALQALSRFTYSPCRVSIGQYFALTVLVKLLAFSAFSALMLALSAALGNPILNYLAGLALFGANLLLGRLDASKAPAHLNLVTAAGVNSLFTRYRAANLFGAVAGYLPLMCVLFSLLVLAGAFTAALLHVHGGEVPRPAWFGALSAFFLTAGAKLRSAVRRMRAARTDEASARVYSMSLVRAEVFKTLVSSRFLALLLLILVAKGWYSARLYEAKPSYADSVYKEYMTELEGPWTEEKSEWIAAERVRIDGILAGKDAMQEAYRSGELELSAYRDYLTEYSQAEARSELFRTVERHERYLMEKGSGWFLYDTGWRRLFSGDADLFLYAALLMLLTGSFAGEAVSRSSSGGFMKILRTTRRGREETFRAKLISGGSIAVVLAVLSFTVDAFFAARNYALPSPSAPVVSVELFGAYGGKMTVAGYLVLFFALRVLGAFLMAMLVSALSEILARYLPVLGSAVVLTLCPALFAAFGWRAAERVSFLSLLAGTPLFLDSARLSLFGSGWAMLGLWIAAAGIAVTALLWPARRMFVE